MCTPQKALSVLSLCMAKNQDFKDEIGPFGVSLMGKPFSTAVKALCISLCTIVGTHAVAETPSGSKANAISAYIDQTEIIHLPYPAGSLIIGNPSVANIAIHDDRTLLLTGKAFGATNLIVLDGIGRRIYETQIRVDENRAGDKMTIARGMATQTYSCASLCRPTR